MRDLLPAGVPRRMAGQQVTQQMYSRSTASLEPKVF
jgi:hypothetical protein